MEPLRNLELRLLWICNESSHKIMGNQSIPVYTTIQKGFSKWLFFLIKKKSYCILKGRLHSHQNNTKAIACECWSTEKILNFFFFLFSVFMSRKRTKTLTSFRNSNQIWRLVCLKIAFPFRVATYMHIYTLSCHSFTKQNPFFERTENAKTSYLTSNLPRKVASEEGQ